MRICATYAELNNLVKIIGTKMTFAPRCEGCFALTYDPGVFLPNITLRLRKHMMASSYIKFKYESDSFFMLSAAQFFSALPEAVKLDKNNKIITIYPSQFEALKNANKTICLSSFDIKYDSIDLCAYFG